MHKFYLTFVAGGGFRNQYVVIEVHKEEPDKAYGEARRVAFEHFGPKWCMVYTEADFEGQVEKFGLHQMAYLVENFKRPVHAKDES